MSTWNPRYTLYARSQGRTPEQQLKHDQEVPGASMFPFIEWNNDQWRAFWAETGKSRQEWENRGNYGDEYDEWLQGKYPEPKEQEDGA